MAENEKKHCAASISLATPSRSWKQVRPEALVGVADGVELDVESFVQSILESDRDIFDCLKQFETKIDR